MVSDVIGWLWPVLFGLLALGIAYGIMAWRHRRKDRATENARDAATRRAYEPNEANRP
jgi:Flp pilus assembly protein TadB